MKSLLKSPYILHFIKKCSSSSTSPHPNQHFLASLSNPSCLPVSILRSLVPDRILAICFLPSSSSIFRYSSLLSFVFIVLYVRNLSILSTFFCHFLSSLFCTLVSSITFHFLSLSFTH